MAIIELTKENLVKLNFDDNNIENLLKSDDYVLDLNLCVYASNISGKIYTEQDYYTRTYNKNSHPIFPFGILDLIPEYYTAKQEVFLEQRCELLGKAFIINAEKELFRENELKKCENVINYYTNLFKTRPELIEKHIAVIGKKAYKIWLENSPHILKPQQNENDETETLYTPKPCFKSELIDRITKDLNAFFEVSQQVELKRIIETGSNANVKLLFRDNGNKLTDYFRELFNNNTITGCTKTVLINWIIDSFKYTNKGLIKDYDFKTVEKTISNKDRLCKNPII